MYSVVVGAHVMSIQDSSIVLLLGFISIKELRYIACGFARR